MLPDPLWDFSQGIWYFGFWLCISFPIFKREIIQPYLTQCSCSFFGGKLCGPKQVQTERQKYFQWSENHSKSTEIPLFPSKKKSQRGFLCRIKLTKSCTHGCPTAVPRSLVIRSFTSLPSSWFSKKNSRSQNKCYQIHLQSEMDFSSGVSSDSELCRCLPTQQAQASFPPTPHSPSLSSFFSGLRAELVSNNYLGRGGRGNLAATKSLEDAG